MKFLNETMLVLFLIVVAGVGVSSAQEEAMEPAAEEAEETFMYNDNGRRDPFWQLVGPGGVINNFETDYLITDLYLEGTMASPDGGGMAIINGQILKKNDKIGQFSIFKIDTSSVTLMKGRQVYKLELKKED